MWGEALQLLVEEDKVSGLDFEKYFYHNKNRSVLRMKALNGRLHELRNRFISWRIFLGILPETGTLVEWGNKLELMRRDYAAIILSLEQATHPIETEHPLSPAVSNPWNVHFEERQLRTVIKQDVDRTNQSLQLFRNEKVKETLTQVLLTWARRNPSISYHQGMNEIAGVLLYVALCEQAAFPLDIEPDASQWLQRLNDPSSIEADVFWMFTSIMNLSIKDLFRGRDVQDDSDPLLSSHVRPTRRGASVLKRISDIHHVYLKDLDRELYQSLESNGVEPQLHLLLHKTLVLWDAILAYGEDLELLDFICVAMQMYVRESRKG